MKKGNFSVKNLNTLVFLILRSDEYVHYLTTIFLYCRLGATKQKEVITTIILSHNMLSSQVYFCSKEPDKENIETSLYVHVSVRFILH